MVATGSSPSPSRLVNVGFIYNPSFLPGVGNTQSDYGTVDLIIDMQNIPITEVFANFSQAEQYIKHSINRLGITSDTFHNADNAEVKSKFVRIPPGGEVANNSVQTRFFNVNLSIELIEVSKMALAKTFEYAVIAMYVEINQAINIYQNKPF